MPIVILITASSKKEAARIAEALIKERLVACVNTLDNVTSLFWWQGKVDRAQETLLILKSRKEKLPAIIRRVKALHSYEVPEIIALPIVAGEKNYLKWINDSLMKPS
jgi:periplasmic divalent cation tolerance protein